MGLMRWMRGGDENSATANALGAGMAEIDALFRPSKHKQTEHIHESRRRRVDINNGAGSDVDLETGIAVVRRPEQTDAAAVPDGSAAVPDDSDDAPPAAVDAETSTANRRRRARIIRRGGTSPATLTVSAAASESEDSADTSR